MSLNLSKSIRSLSSKLFTSGKAISKFRFPYGFGTWVLAILLLFSISDIYNGNWSTIITLIGERTAGIDQQILEDMDYLRQDGLGTLKTLYGYILLLVDLYMLKYWILLIKKLTHNIFYGKDQFPLPGYVITLILLVTFNFVYIAYVGGVDFSNPFPGFSEFLQYVFDKREIIEGYFGAASA